MRSFKYCKVDAFTSVNSKGNPAAFIELGREALTPAEMLEIGKEHAGFVSEIVFCGHSDNADIKLTYYSSECEVDFCGHGTIATMYEIIKSNEKLLGKRTVTIETNRKGLLTVYNLIADENAIYITAPAAQFLRRELTAAQIADALGISPSQIDERFAVDCIDAGLRTLLVPIDGLANEISMYPDEKYLKTFCEANELDIVLAFCMSASSDSFIAHTRVFAPRFGYLEDPATGSGNSAFANYLLKNSLWNGEPALIEQGGDNIAFNTVNIRSLNGDILFGGKATLKISGEYYL